MEDKDEVVINKEALVMSITSSKISSDLINASEVESENILTDNIYMRSLGYASEDGTGWIVHLDENCPKDDQVPVCIGGSLQFKRINEKYIHKTNKIKDIYEFKIPSNKNFKACTIYFTSNMIIHYNNTLKGIDDLNTTYSLYINEKNINDETIIIRDILLPSKSLFYLYHYFTISIPIQPNKETILKLKRKFDKDVRISSNKTNIMVEFDNSRYSIE